MASIIYSFIQSKIIEKIFVKSCDNAKIFYDKNASQKIKNTITIITDPVWVEQLQKNYIGRVYIKTDHSNILDDNEVIIANDKILLAEKSTQTEDTK